MRTLRLLTGALALLAAAACATAPAPLVPAPVAKPASGAAQRRALRLTYDVGTAYDGEDPATAPARTRDFVARRLDEAGLGAKVLSVTLVGRKLVVDLDGTSDVAVTETKELLARSGRLELARADDGTDFMGAIRDEDLPDGEGIAIYQETVPIGIDAGGQPAIATPHFARITVRPERYPHETMADCRVRLERWIATLHVPADHRLGIEAIVTSDPDTHATAEEGFRTIYLFRAADLTGASIANATAVAGDPSTGMGAYVSLTFDADGARRFEALTAANLEKRIALLVDGTVDTTPIVKSKITRGRATITMAPEGTPEAQLARANELAVVLRTGALPAPLRLAREEIVVRP